VANDPRLKTELNCITKDLRRTILDIKQQSIEAYVQELTDDDESTDHSLWKATKRLKRPRMNIPPLRKQDRTWAKDEKEKADVFAEHLLDIMQQSIEAYVQELTDDASTDHSLWKAKKRLKDQ